MMTDRPADAELPIIDKSVEFMQSEPWPFPALILVQGDSVQSFQGLQIWSRS